MYDAFFGLRQRPFAAIPDAQFYFPVEAMEQAKTNLLRAVGRAEGVGLIIGSAGTGKSLLCALVAEHCRQQFQIAMLTSARLCTRRALLQNILFELKLPFRDMEEGELRLSLIDHLEPSDRCANGVLLIVDEGHTLPLRLLEEIRMITNLVRGGQPRVRLVLAGDPELEEKLATPRLASFQQRIAVRCYMHNLSQSETAQMVQHQLQRAGAKLPIFDDAALVALHQATDGVPRLVNQVCDHALVLACAGGKRTIDARGIEEAWSDLQQLPTPWTTKANKSGELPAIIEFGQLSDDSSATWHDFEEQFSRTPTAASEAPFAAYDGDEGILELDAADVRGQLKDVEAKDHAFKATDPFGGPFADEEVVLDRYASWDSQMRRRPHVRSTDGEQIAAALRSAKHVESQETVEHSLVTSIGELRSTAQQAIGVNDSPAAVDDAAGLVQPTQIIGGFNSWDEQWWTAHVMPPATQQNWSDDRDMLIIEEEGPTAATTGALHSTMRPEYLRLLEQLRDG